MAGDVLEAVGAVLEAVGALVMVSEAVPDPVAVVFAESVVRVAVALNLEH